MKIKSLSHATFDEIIECFLLAFENYYVKFPTDKNYYKNRWTAAKVDWNLTYGMFDQDKLIGFIIHAVDTRFGTKVAYNAGTGVIPEYRGRKIVNAIYDFAIQELKNNGIKKSTLEVIQENERAIRAYQNVGFKKCKEYYCFGGIIKTESIDIIQIKEIPKEDFNWQQCINQESYAWDFQKETIIEREYKYFEVHMDNKIESYFIINPENKNLAQFEILVEDKDAWKRLFYGINQISTEANIVNVDSTQHNKLDASNNAQLKRTVNQYEMELEL